MNNSLATQAVPTVLIIGSSGQVGSRILKEFAANPDGVSMRFSSRRQAEVDQLRADGKDAVLLDLDEPRTFGAALRGVDRVFLLNSYSVEMLTQSKTLVDAARKAGVQHIVHLGTFGEWDTTDPHFAWHQMVERYIEASGMAWTHLHPNVFMENLLTFFAPRGGALTVYWGEQRAGWVALGDVAAAAATVLREGPPKHHGKDYWMSTEALSAPAMAAILTEETGRPVRSECKLPNDFQALVDSGAVPMEKWYAAGAVEFMRQIYDGRMGYIGSVRDDVPHLTGREATTFRAWARANLPALVTILAA
jgi:NAD(P)H dehydrogenase (quinone)